MKKHIKVSVKGKVQGVYYRASTKTKAVELGVNGWVKNMDDGSVYLEAEGASEALDLLVQWCHQGPPMAEVVEVKVQDSAALEGFKSFDVRY